MIDAVQIILIVVIVALAILLVVLGIQVFFILRDVSKTLRKANKVLDDTGSIAQSVARPLSTVSSLVEHASTGALAAKVISVIFKAIKKDESGVEEGKKRRDEGA